MNKKQIIELLNLKLYEHFKKIERTKKIDSFGVKISYFLTDVLDLLNTKALDDLEFEYLPSDFIEKMIQRFFLNGGYIKYRDNEVLREFFIDWIEEIKFNEHKEDIFILKTVLKEILSLEKEKLKLDKTFDEYFYNNLNDFLMFYDLEFKTYNRLTKESNLIETLKNIFDDVVKNNNGYTDENFIKTINTYDIKKDLLEKNDEEEM